jgi:hypothetical protein
MRIDKDLLDKIIDSSEKRIWEGGGLTQEDARKFIADELKEMPGKRDRDAGDTLGEGPTSGIVFNSIMSARDKWVIENGARLHECWRDSLVAGDIYEFLTNVPSNIVWHCYLNAIPRALAERTGSVNELREVVGSYAHAGTLGQGVGSNPIFQVMQHGGLSALAMFVFSTGTQEFRQIIKLSDYQKIKDEAENYRNYVRYNVPLSARLPTSGKTYEGDGNTEGAVDRIGKIPRSLRSFGALVSDLIAGSRDEERPITLLDRVIELTLSPISGEPAAGRDVIARNNEILEFESAIRYQFKNNTSRWRDWPGVNQWTSPHTNVTDKVRAITRVFLNGDDALLRLNRRLGTGPIEYDKLIKLCVEKLVGVPFRDVADRLQAISREGAEVRMIDARQLGSVIHGDLNARNLVWSKDYVKFFMIDFERVGMGFYGADQIRLVFSLLSDLVVDAYRKERFGATVRTHELEGRIDEVEKILEDVNSAIAHTALITKAVENWQPDEGQPVKLPPPPVGGVAARAVSVILDDDMFSKGNRAFWTFAIAMTAAKQFEYALRGIDDSCTETLKIVAAKVDVDGDRFNLYRYFEHDELKQRKHDKFVFGKIARVLLAYRALASTLIIGDSNVLPA